MFYRWSYKRFGGAFGDYDLDWIDWLGKVWVYINLLCFLVINLS